MQETVYLFRKTGLQILPIPTLVHSLVKEKTITDLREVTRLEMFGFQHLAAIAVLHPATAKLASGRATGSSAPGDGLHYQTHQKCLKKRKRRRELPRKNERSSAIAVM